MLKIKYAIYRIDDEDNYVSLNDKTYEEIIDVAMDLIHINNERLDSILKEMFDITETLESIDIEEFIFDALTNYTLKLARCIEKHFSEYISKQISIEMIPDFKYLDELRVHIFTID